MAKDESLMASPAPASLPLDESVDDEMVQLGPEARKILSQVEAELRGAQGPPNQTVPPLRAAVRARGTEARVLFVGSLC